MTRSSSRKSHATSALGFFLACVIALAPATALAETSQELQSRLELAKGTLNELEVQVLNAGERLYETEYALNETNRRIDETNAAIQDKETEHAIAKETLARRVKAAYKAGALTPLAMLFDDGGLEKFAAYPYYANKIAEQDAQTIREVEDAKASLENEAAELAQLKADQETLAEQQRTQLGIYQGAERAQAVYVQSLDQALRDRLAEEQERELLEQKAAAGDAQAQFELELARQRDEEQQYTPTYVSDMLPKAADGINIADITGTARSSMSNSTRLTILNAALSQVGTPYVLGGEEPGTALDCSGFTQYCYRQAGIELPHSAAEQSVMARSSSIENLQPGDLIFWIGTGDPTITGNHVAMYLGDGKIIHAVLSGVKIGTLYDGYTKFGVIL